MRIFLFSLAVFAFLVPAQAQSPTDAKQDKDTASANGNIELLWSHLADLDAAKAYRAIWALTQTPKETVALIGAKLAPHELPMRAKCSAG
jgi:hypothetical protein